MRESPGIRRWLATFAVLDIMMATLIVVLLFVSTNLLSGYLFIFVHYQEAFTGLSLLLGAMGAGLCVHGIALIGDIIRKPRTSVAGRNQRILQGLVPSIVYSALVVVAVVFFTASSSAFGSLQQDLGFDFTNAILFLAIAILVSLCIVIAGHLILASTGLTIPSKRKSTPRAPEQHRPVLAVTRQGIGKLQAIAMLAVIAGTVATYGLTILFSPPVCFSGTHSFSAPAYDLATVQSGLHMNAVIDNPSTVNQTVLDALELGLWRMTTTQSQGGFPLEALLDGSEFYSDRGSTCPLHPGEFSIQGGTPLIAGVYLAMYQVEPNPVYLNVAAAAARALMAVQDAGNGGFYYDGRLYPDGAGYQPHPRNPRHAAVFDDNTMQSALAFLLDMYDVTANDTYKNAAIRGLDYLLKLEKPGGGWPQRSNYGSDEYPSYITLNDDCMQDIVNLMFKAYDVLGDSRYMRAVERAGQFLARVQGNGAGSNLEQVGAWAQQYKDDQPAWARRFEPKAMCSAQTARTIDILMELYVRTGNETYLDPIPAAAAWLTNGNTTIVDEWDSPGQVTWARLYELETNRLIVGNRNNQDNGVVYYYDYMPARDYGYSWIGNYGINGTLDKYDYLVTTCNKNISQYLAWRDLPATAPSLLSNALYASSMLHSSGFWLDGEGKIDDEMFYWNAMPIIQYLDVVA